MLGAAVIFTFKFSINFPFLLFCLLLARFLQKSLLWPVIGYISIINFLIQRVIKKVERVMSHILWPF